jgi:CxxC motif-containing protein
MKKSLTCIVCPNGCRIRCEKKQDEIVCSGQACKRGEAYAKSEMTRPMRTLTTSVKTIFPDSPVISVRTDGEIEKGKILDAAKLLDEVLVHQRLKIGDVVVKNICDTGVNIICTSDKLAQSY